MAGNRISNYDRQQAFWAKVLQYFNSQLVYNNVIFALIRTKKPDTMKKLFLAVAIVGMTGFAFGQQQQAASTSKDSKATTKTCTDKKCCKKDGSCTKDSKKSTTTSTTTTSDKK